LEIVYRSYRKQSHRSGNRCREGGLNKTPSLQTGMGFRPRFHLGFQEDPQPNHEADVQPVS